jgi:DNA helicase HerA-like ATPase
VSEDSGIFIGLGSNGEPQRLVLRRANRHGLIAGRHRHRQDSHAPGHCRGFLGSRRSRLPRRREGRSCRHGYARIADLAASSDADRPAPPSSAWRASLCRQSAIFWDLFGEQGHPVRTTVSEMGPLLLARLMNLNETQEGVLNIAFRVADEEGLLLLNLEDLQALLLHCAENASDLSGRYGNVTKPSVGAIQRQLLQLESQGGGKFFGEPALEIADLLKVDEQGRGYVNILAADKLMASPKLYATFLLWLLSELFEELPEVGDPDKPKLVFFFDEAHLLFNDAPKALEDKIEQVVRLIRSKGVGVYFITQNPIDVPEKVGGQLGNRVQHALRAYTPRDQKAIRAAAETFRINPRLDVATAITELKVGEALVSVLQEDGSPTPVERTLIKPPRSRLGPLTERERAIIQSTSPFDGKYDETIDRESAEEILKARGEESVAAAAAAKTQARKPRRAAVPGKDDRARAPWQRERPGPPERRANPPLGQEVVRQVGKAVQRQMINRVAGTLVRGILGGLFKGR